MASMAKIGHAARVLAYRTKDQLVQALGRFEGQDARALMDDLQEAREILSELRSTIEAVELRLIVAGALIRGECGAARRQL
jgi:hypothetical protein